MTAALRYRVSIAEPSQHLIDVELCVPGPHTGDLELAMAAWSPGSYLVRDYARWVRDVEATAGGAEAAIVKTTKQTWRVECAGADEVTVRYRVYGHELSVRTNHVDATHAFIHGPATFLYPPGRIDGPCQVDIVNRDDLGWQVVCGLAERDGVRLAADVDELLDAPIHIGRVVREQFEVADRPVTLAVWGELDGAKEDELQDAVAELAADLAAVAAGHVERFGGDVPYDDYTFILMLSPGGFGGLEHRNSSANMGTPFSMTSEKAYQALLELLSHEYFHVWNGKRIAPAALSPCDYSGEMYTRCLWVVEGITSYLDRYALCCAERMSAKRYLDKLAEEWGRLAATPGRHRHSIEDASMDAWIKLYKADESNVNTTVSYYLKGGLVAMALDLHIRRRSAGERSLDDVLRYMWQQFGRSGRGYPENVQPAFEAGAELDLGEFFDAYVRGRDNPPLGRELEAVGLELRETWDRRTAPVDHDPVWLGLTLLGGRTRVAVVFDGSPAAAAGVSPGDELIAIDGYRIGRDADLRARLRARPPATVAALAVFRRDRLMELPVTLETAPPNRFELVGVDDPSESQLRGYRAWLGEDHPGPGVVSGATVSHWT